MPFSFSGQRCAWGLLSATISAIMLQIVGRALKEGNGIDVEKREGYWSPVTSNIDWCEPNYLLSYHVVELWNSISSTVIVAEGLHILRKARRHQMSWPCLLQGFNIFSIGVGSALFHGTLTRWAQWMDELPMFGATLVAAGAFYAGQPCHSPSDVRSYCGFWICLVFVVIIALLILPRELGAPTFQVAFISSVLEMVRRARQYSSVCRSDPKLAHLPAVLDCAVWGAALAGLAWAADFAVCDPAVIQSSPWFGASPHIVWHFVVTYTTHALAELGTFAISGDAARRSMGAELHFVFGVPFIGNEFPSRPDMTEQKKMC